MNSRELFWKEWGVDGKPSAIIRIVDAAWQAAWEARGKHDAEICRNIPKEYAIPDYGDQVVTLCAQAIEDKQS